MGAFGRNIKTKPLEDYLDECDSESEEEEQFVRYHLTQAISFSMCVTKREYREQFVRYHLTQAMAGYRGKPIRLYEMVQMLADMTHGVARSQLLMCAAQLAQF